MADTKPEHEWLTAAEALRLVAAEMGPYLAPRTIAIRAYDGLVRAKAARFFKDDAYRDDMEVPQDFWWAKGDAALTQNWASGDFDTWMGRGEHHWRAYGVRFFREDIEKIAPPSSEIAAPANRTKISKRSRRVFIVHGHDEGPREAVANFLRQLHFDPIILHAQPNRGGTVIEKVEANSDVAFAVVLLTPDDEGCAKGETPRPRPRQNVLLELGYFIGLLGRKRVCVVTRGEIEWPSDILGVVPVPYDGGWKLALGTELKAAGFEVDLNKLMP